MQELAMQDDPRPADLVAKLAYEEALRAVSQQGTSLDELRARTGALLSAAIIATSFLGAIAAKGGGPGLPHKFWGPVGLFMGVALLCTIILLPLPGWFLTLNATVLLDSVDIANPPPIFAVFASGVTELTSARESNQNRLTLMFTLFGVAAMAVVGELVWWVIVIL
jgi:hypothetical protein